MPVAGVFAELLGNGPDHGGNSPDDGDQCKDRTDGHDHAEGRAQISDEIKQWAHGKYSYGN
jgi:hypothetical protein